MATDLDKVKRYAKDLRTTYPRSPREKLGGYVIAARSVDKCRAFLLGINGEYITGPVHWRANGFRLQGLHLSN